MPRVEQTYYIKRSALIVSLVLTLDKKATNMSKLDKTGQSGLFYQLDKCRRKAVRLIYADELTDEQQSKSPHRSRSALDNWKYDVLFKTVQQQYNQLSC